MNVKVGKPWKVKHDSTCLACICRDQMQQAHPKFLSSTAQLAIASTENQNGNPKLRNPEPSKAPPPKKLYIGLT
eukprot:6163144-Amphidinium_carterae.1